MSTSSTTKSTKVPQPAQLSCASDCELVRDALHLEESNRSLATEIERRKREEQTLWDIQNDLRLVIDTIPGMVWSALPDGSVEYLNKRWLDYTGLSLPAASGWGWQSAVHPDDLPGLLNYWKSILATPMSGEYEARLRRYDGEYRWCLFQGTPLYDKHGKVVKWYGNNTDIETLRSLQRTSRGQFEALRHTLIAVVEEANPDKLVEHVLRMITCQLEAQSISVWQHGEDDKLILTATFEEDRVYFPAKETSLAAQKVWLSTRHNPVWAEVFRTGQDCIIGELDYDPPRMRLANRDDVPWYPWHGNRPHDPFVEQMCKRYASMGVVSNLLVPMMIGGTVTGVLGVRFRQHRAHKQEELELTRALGHQAMLALELMRLSRQIRTSATLEERNRMAREIHDTLAQGFTGVIVQLEAAQDARSKGLSEASEQHIDRALQLARENLHEARRSVHALRPQVLSEKTLCTAIRELVEKMTGGTPLHVRVQVEGPPPVSAQHWEQDLLRICQEVLTNTLRHAQATEFAMALKFGEAQVTLTLSDNGKGFLLQSESRGFGLIGIEERVQSMNGRLKIDSTPGHGTHITVTIPVDRAHP